MNKRILKILNKIKRIVLGILMFTGFVMAAGECADLKKELIVKIIGLLIFIVCAIKLDIFEK